MLQCMKNFFRKNLESEAEIELRRRRTRNWKIVGITALVIFLTAGSLWYFLRRPDSDNADLYGNADLYDKDHIVMATGVTESGADTVTFAVRFPGNISLGRRYRCGRRTLYKIHRRKHPEGARGAGAGSAADRPGLPGQSGLVRIG